MSEQTLSEFLMEMADWVESEERSQNTQTATRLCYKRAAACREWAEKVRRTDVVDISNKRLREALAIWVEEVK